MNKIFSLSGMPPNSISSSWIYPLCWITFCIYVCMYAVSSKFMCLERTNDVQQIGLFLTRGSRTSNVNLRFSSENAKSWTWTNHIWAKLSRLELECALFWAKLLDMHWRMDSQVMPNGVPYVQNAQCALFGTKMLDMPWRMDSQVTWTQQCALCI